MIHDPSETLHDPSAAVAAADEPRPVLGIDVAKLTLDLCLLRHARPLHARFENCAQGHRAMLAWLAAQGVQKALVALEATGHYSLAPATAALLAGHRVAMLNPRRVLEFARSAGRRNKTDRADALVIARFAATQPVEDWQPLPPAQAALRDLLRRQTDLEAALQAEERRLECAAPFPALRQSLRRSLRWLAAELARLEKDLAAHLAASSALAQDVARLQAIPGIGEKTARLLTAELPRHFKNARAIAAWLGVVPRQCQSGTSVRKTSRIGHAAPLLRSRLYFPALTAMRHDPRSKAFAEKLRAAGKTPKSILFAVLHKLIRTAFALLQSSSTYDPNHSLFSHS